MQENFREKMKQNPEGPISNKQKFKKKGRINIYINKYISIYICLEAIDDQFSPSKCKEGFQSLNELIRMLTEQCKDDTY